MAGIIACLRRETMQLNIQENELEQPKRRVIRSGIAGNYEVVLEMIRVTRNTVAHDLSIERLAKQIITDKRLDSYSSVGKQLTAIYKFVKANVVYIQDVAGLVESIKSARVTLSDGYGDCDDLSNTIASLVGCLGFENVYFAMARYSDEIDSFEHIYPVVYAKGERIPMDATLPNGKLGEEIPTTHIQEIPIFQEVKGLDGISGLFNNIRYQSKKLGRVAIETMPAVAEHLPLGFVASRAFSTGAQLLKQSASGDLSLNALGSRINQKLDAIIVALIRSQMALDLARSEALQYVSQLGTVQDRGNAEVYAVVKRSVQAKYEFINNFADFAKVHNIRVVELNPTAMLTAGVIGAGIGGYALYRLYQESKRS